MSDENKEIILFESDEAATFKTNISGWVSRNGLFFGDSEQAARYNGCTHRACECGNVHEKMWTKCAQCRTKSNRERYLNLPEKEWTGEPLVIFNTEDYFFHENEVYDFLAEFDGEDPEFVICEPVVAPYIEDYGIDQLPEEMFIDDIDPKLSELIGAVNHYIVENKPVLSWQEGRFRTKVIGSSSAHHKSRGR